MPKEHLILKTEDGVELPVVRQLPDAFRRVRPDEASVWAPAEEVDYAKLSLEVVEKLLEPDHKRVSDAVEKMGDGPLVRTGMVCPGYNELRSSFLTAPGFSLVDFLPPAFLDLTSWGKYVRREGLVEYVPTPGELLQLLEGKPIELPAPPKDEYGRDKQIFIAVPALDSVASSEVEVALGNRSTLALSKVIQLDAKLPEKKGAALVTGDNFIDNAGTPSRGLASYAQGLVTSFANYERIASVVLDEKRIVRLGAEAGGNSKVFPKEVWLKVLPVLDQVWKQREALIKETTICGTERSTDASELGRETLNPAGFRLGFETFGFSSVSVLPEQIQAELERTKASLEKVFAEPKGPVFKATVADEVKFKQRFDLPFEQWDPRAFAFFLRQFDLNVLQPLGLKGPKGGYVSYIRGALNVADQGYCYSASQFYALLPGKKAGFRKFMEETFGLAAKMIELNRYAAQKDLPRVFSFEFPFEGKKDFKAYLDRSLFMEQAAKTLQVAPEKPLEVEFPLFGPAWRRMAGEAHVWPKPPGSLGDEDPSKRKASFAELREKYLDRLPVNDPILDLVRKTVGVLSDKRSEDLVPLTLWGKLDAYVHRVRDQVAGGYRNDVSVFRMEGLLTGGVMPKSALPKLTALLAPDPGFVGPRQLVQELNQAAKHTEKRPGLLGQPLLRFQAYDPLNFSEADMVTLSPKDAFKEVYRWYVRHPELARRFEPEVDATVVPVELVPLVEKVNKVLQSGVEHFQKVPQATSVTLGQGSVSSVLQICRSLQQKTLDGSIETDMGAAVIEAMRLVRETPVFPVVHQGALTEKELGLVNALASAVEYDDFLQVLHDHDVMPGIFSFAPADREVLEAALKDRQQVRDQIGWNVGLVHVVQELFEPMQELARKAPYLLHYDLRFSALHPSNLMNLHAALLSQVPAVVYREPLQKFCSAVTDLSGHPWTPELVASVKAQAKMEEYSKLLQQGPLFKGVAFDGNEEGGRLAGMGSVYLKVLAENIPDFLPGSMNLQFTPYQLPVLGDFNPALPRIDLMKAPSSLRDAYRANYLFRVQATPAEVELPKQDYSREALTMET